MNTQASKHRSARVASQSSSLPIVYIEATDSFQCSTGTDSLTSSNLRDVIAWHAEAVASDDTDVTWLSQRAARAARDEARSASRMLGASSFIQRDEYDL